MAGRGRHFLGHSWVPFFIFTWCSRVKMSSSSQTKLFMSGFAVVWRLTWYSLVSGFMHCEYFQYLFSWLYAWYYSMPVFPSDIFFLDVWCFTMHLVIYTFFHWGSTIVLLNSVWILCSGTTCNPKPPTLYLYSHILLHLNWRQHVLPKRR